ncbi:MAG: glutathione S-transferase [Ponticaulis sp.]|nr:glutathione S-transferase [Ponticaulis sp.]|tara:strand:- start:4214 stop:4825 length:612 start_codon:yes stop_codon:yes gene_type:complete
MLTFYHSPQTRSTRVLALIHAMGKLDEVELKTVSIPRQDGGGGPDDSNPHPEKKVPLLVHNGELIRETPAIMVYLTDHFKSPLGRQVGETGRGEYLSWMAYYGGVVEPVLVGGFAGVGDNPVFQSTFRGMAEIEETLVRALTGQDWLMTDGFTAVDLIMVSPFLWMPDAVPENELIRAWVKRCSEHPSMVWATEQDAKALQSA